MPPESIVAPKKVTGWVTASGFVQATVWPALTVTVAGLNAKLTMPTRTPAAAAGAARAAGPEVTAEGMVPDPMAAMPGMPAMASPAPGGTPCVGELAARVPGPPAATLFGPGAQPARPTPAVPPTPQP